jgi:hypothetical protein
LNPPEKKKQKAFVCAVADLAGKARVMVKAVWYKKEFFFKEEPKNFCELKWGRFFAAAFIVRRLKIKGVSLLTQPHSGTARRPSLTLLAACIAITTILSLSVHAVMFDTFGIAHPDMTRVPTAAIVLNDALSVVATIVFTKMSSRAFNRFPMILRCIFLTTIYAMLGEALLRNLIMDIVVSHDWVYCFVENLPRPLEDLSLCSLIVIAAPRLKTSWAMAVAGTAIAAVAVLVINPPIDRLFAHFVASIEYLDTGNIYNPPYGWQVDVPSYLTFLEPVLASYAIAALVLDQMSPVAWRRLLQFAVLIMAMKGSIVPMLVYSFYQPRPLPAALLSESQFTLEILVMGMLTAIFWRRNTRRTGA